MGKEDGLFLNEKPSSFPNLPTEPIPLPPKAFSLIESLSPVPGNAVIRHRDLMRREVWCLALVAAFLFSVLPAQAAMDHGSGAAHYSDRAFLSGMIAHHEGAVDMAKVFLATPKKDQDPQVTAWADDVIKVQEKEIAEMKELLKPLGGIEESAYAPMKKAMQHMLEEGKNLGANMRFVELMLPHHAMALEMSVPALLGSNNPQILNLAENIIISQAKEMRQFKAWIAEHHKK